MAGSYYVYPTSIPICRDIALAEPLCEAGMDLFVGKSDQTNSVSWSKMKTNAKIVKVI